MKNIYKKLFMKIIYAKQSNKHLHSTLCGKLCNVVCTKGATIMK